MCFEDKRRVLEIKMSGDAPNGYVRVVKEGNTLRTGSRVERVNRFGEVFTVGWDFADFCPVMKYKGLRPREPLRPSGRLSSDLSERIKGRYIKMPPAIRYAEGVYALRRACESDFGTPHPKFTNEDGSRNYRPLTFAENLAARLQDPSLFEEWLFSCTGIAYKRDTTKVKIIPRCEELITIPEGFKKPYLKIDYHNLDHDEFDSSKVRCNQLLSRIEAKAYPLWLAAADYDKDLLSDTVDYVFDQLKIKSKDKGMGFLVQENVAEDQLRALSVNYLFLHSNANGYANLNDDVLFLRVVAQ